MIFQSQVELRKSKLLKFKDIRIPPTEKVKWGKLMDLILHKDNDGFLKTMEKIRDTIHKKRQIDSFAEVISHIFNFLNKNGSIKFDS